MVKRVVGIDPGATTGVAIYNRKIKKIEAVHTLTFWPCVNTVKLYDPDETLVIIETPLRTVMYAKQARKGYTGGGQNRLMADAAANAREAELLADGLEILGYKVRRVRPVAEKWKADHCRRISGYEGATNQHVRDAIALCFGV